MSPLEGIADDLAEAVHVAEVPQAAWGIIPSFLNHASANGSRNVHLLNRAHAPDHERDYLRLCYRQTVVPKNCRHCCHVHTAVAEKE